MLKSHGRLCNNIVITQIGINDEDRGAKDGQFKLSPSLAVWLSRRFKLEATAVRDLGLGNAEDRDIFDTARKADVGFLITGRLPQRRKAAH